jgi:regulatory protein
MRITKIERQRNKPRYTIYLDSGPPLDIHGETLLRFGLRRNDELDDQKLRQLQLEDLFQTAKQKSLRFLSHRPRSEKEIRDRLKKERLD